MHAMIQQPRGFTLLFSVEQEFLRQKFSAIFAHRYGVVWTCNCTQRADFMVSTESHSLVQSPTNHHPFVCRKIPWFLDNVSLWEIFRKFKPWANFTHYCNLAFWKEKSIKWVVWDSAYWTSSHIISLYSVYKWGSKIEMSHTWQIRKNALLLCECTDDVGCCLILTPRLASCQKVPRGLSRFCTKRGEVYLACRPVNRYTGTWVPVGNSTTPVMKMLPGY